MTNATTEALRISHAPLPALRGSGQKTQRHATASSPDHPAARNTREIGRPESWSERAAPDSPSAGSGFRLGFATRSVGIERLRLVAAGPLTLGNTKPLHRGT